MYSSSVSRGCAGRYSYHSCGLRSPNGTWAGGEPAQRSSSPTSRAPSRRLSYFTSPPPTARGRCSKQRASTAARQQRYTERSPRSAPRGAGRTVGSRRRCWCRRWSRSGSRTIDCSTYNTSLPSESGSSSGSHSSASGQQLQSQMIREPSRRLGGATPGVLHGQFQRPTQQALGVPQALFGLADSGAQIVALRRNGQRADLRELLSIALDMFGNDRQGCGNRVVHERQSDVRNVESGLSRAWAGLYRGRLCIR